VRVVSAEAIRAAVSLDDLIDPVQESLVRYSRGQASVAAVGILRPLREAEVHVKSAAVAECPIFAVKVASTFPDNAALGLAASQGAVLVLSAVTGVPLAALEDGGYLTDLRTAAAGAACARALAPAGPVRLTVVGAGVQARLQALAVARVRPVAAVEVWARRPAAAAALAQILAEALSGVPVAAVGDLERSVRRADVVVTATSSRQPLVRADWLRPGQLVTAVGADDPEKVELEPACLLRPEAYVAVDSRSQNALFGEVARAGDAAVDAELGELFGGGGGPAADRFTVAKLTGVAVQDVAAAEVTLRRLGIGVA
jgi:ornithine cyclodeaminase/alanine dehydrogenase-like protein (mu-crystallin family)